MRELCLATECSDKSRLETSRTHALSPESQARPGETRMDFHPLTPDRWHDFERLFGPHGAYAGCWCMWWRLTRARFEQQKGEANRLAMKAIVDSGRVPGIIGYADGLPVAWCSVAPRSDFGSLNRSRVLKAIDDHPVWSIVCFFVARSHRHRGSLEEVVRAAVGYAADRGATIVEAYPTVTTSTSAPPASSYMGFVHVFAAVGFVEVARPSPAKRIMRVEVGGEVLQGGDQR
jgi:hypothetical protein